MNFSVALMLSFGVPMLSLATTPLPYAGQCALIDRLSTIAVSEPTKSASPLELLERVAEGRTDEIRVDSEAEVGVPPGTLQQAVFAAAAVRACALRKIGETGLPEAYEFLANLQQAVIGNDSGHQIWPAAQIALRDVHLRRILDPQSQIDFLEANLTEPHDAISGSAIEHWATDSLCDRGALISLSAIQKSIRNRWKWTAR